jgi:hypothetical protein
VTFPSSWRSLGLVVGLLSVLGIAPAWAQEGPGFAREGMYVGLAGLLTSTLDGDSFDGMTLYEAETTNEIFILPRLDEQRLPRIVVGFRAPQAALEFSYDRVRHEGTFVDETADAVFNSINVDVRFFALTRGRVQPHAVVGLAFPWLTVEEGSFLEPEFGDARFRGQGLNTEVGVTVFPTPRIGLSAGYVYRVFWFNRVQGVGEESFRLDPRFRETSSTVTTMGFFTF